MEQVKAALARREVAAAHRGGEHRRRGSRERPRLERGQHQSHRQSKPTEFE